MPQKVNPKFVVRLLAEAAELRNMSGMVLETGLSKHEGDAVSNQLLSSAMDRVVPLAWKMTGTLAETLERATPVPAAMARNLALTDGGIAAEGLMMALAPRVGRARAHDILHHALEAGAAQATSPRAAILADSAVAELMSPEQVEAALDPAAYAGDSAAIAREAAAEARKLSARLRG